MAKLEDWSKDNGLYIFWALVVAVIVILIFAFGGGMMMNSDKKDKYLVYSSYEPYITTEGPWVKKYLSNSNM